MNLIDRYIYQVGRRLPGKNRADIQTELKSLILDAVETAGGERWDASKQSVPEDEAAVVAVLKEFGPPEKVAASYWPQSQYLIGPALYPLFRMVAGIVVLAVCGALLLALGIGPIFGVVFGEIPGDSTQSFSLLDALGGLWNAAISAFGMVVLVFAILQYFDVKPEAEEKEWDPRTLPEIEESEEIKPFGLVVEMAFSLVLLVVVWLFADKIGFFGSASGEAASYIINPVIARYVPLISLTLLVGIGLDLVLLRMSGWSLPTRLAKIGANLLDIFVLAQLVSGHTAWLAERGWSGFFTTLEMLETHVGDIALTQVIGMQAFRMGFTVALIVVTIEAILMVVRLVLGKRSGLPQPGR